VIHMEVIHFLCPPVRTRRCTYSICFWHRVRYFNLYKRHHGPSPIENDVF
jgi:hypothetical protein